MKVTVVGQWGGYPAVDGATSAYLFQKDNSTLLVDVGSAAVSKLQKYVSVSDIDAVIVSHYHHDHVADIGVLQYARLINYYVTGDETVLPIYGHKEDTVGFQSLTHTYTKGIAYNPDEALHVGPFSITFLKTNHPVSCYGMRITDGEHVVVYTADSSYTSDWVPFSKDADLLITDCNYYKGMDGKKAGHMNSEEAASIARDGNVKHLLISHLPQYGNQNLLVEEAKQIFQGEVSLAKEGWKWSLSRM